ncbi:MAG: hypothetical protein H6537_10515 [Bacteroidales bacterium]|nr:hypothetical protein [Bacteroidales bacterium]
MGSTIFHKNSEFELVIGNSKINIRSGTEEEYWNSESLFSFSNKEIRILIDFKSKRIYAYCDNLDISNEFTYTVNEQSINYVKITSNKTNYDMEPFYLTTSTIIDYLNIYSIK